LVRVVFDGTNILTQTPCIYDQTRADCGSCSVVLERCGFAVEWGDVDAIRFSGSCSGGGPVFEQATGVVSATIVSSNCAGSSGDISWSATWSGDD
jgi:hypothetical protein